MKATLEKIYFSSDIQQLNSLCISKDFKKALTFHWLGDLSAAADAYTFLDNPNHQLSPIELAFAHADQILIRVKRGLGLPSTLPAEIMKSVSARAILEYAHYTWAFWVDHKIANRALRNLTLLSLRSSCAHLLLTSIFLSGHMMAIKGHSKIGYHLAKLVHAYVVKKLDTQTTLPRFAINIILAAFPYTLLVSGKLGKHIDQAVYIGERHLPQDPYYLSLFQISSLYSFAYGGDVARCELFSDLFKIQHEQGKLLRYLPVSQIMPLLSFAIREYGHLIEENILKILENHDESKSDPLINSQFYRAASVIALNIQKSELALHCISKAETYRFITKSFEAWKPFDENIRKLAQNSQAYDPLQNRVIELSKNFHSPPGLSSVLVKLLNLNDQNPFITRKDYILKISNLLEKHVGGEAPNFSKEAYFKNSAYPKLRVGEVYLTFDKVNEHRIKAIRELLAALTPAIRTALKTFDLYLAARDLEAEARVGEMAKQVAHDIRSPLAALRVLNKNLENISIVQRELLTNATLRIQDIASDLLSKNSRDAQKVTTPDTNTKNETLIQIIESMIKEKRLQFSEKANVSLTLSNELRSDGPYLNAKSKEFSRILSNLLNNSFESISDDGKINILLCSNGTEYIIQIQDSGIGIAPEIIGQLGVKGASFGKTNGLGLGIFHAKKTLESWNGKINYSSKLNMGTTVELRLPHEIKKT